MSYTLYFKNTAVKSIEKLPEKERGKVRAVLESLADNPHTGKKLSGEYRGFYSVRAWPYRIMYTIIKKELVILVVDVAHREDVYK